MSLIQRYSNRKLYDTGARRYVTLEEIAALIRQGEDIHVVDHDSGEDLTTLILSQVILEQAKKSRSSLPRGVLTGLIQAGGDTVHVLRRILAAPATLTGYVDEEIGRRIQALVDSGEFSYQEGLRVREALLGPKSGQSVRLMPSREEIEAALHERGVPTRDDLQKLSEQVDALLAVIDRLSRVPTKAS